MFQPAGWTEFAIGSAKCLCMFLSVNTEFAWNLLNMQTGNSNFKSRVVNPTGAVVTVFVNWRKRPFFTVSFLKMDCTEAIKNYLSWQSWTDLMLSLTPPPPFPKWERMWHHATFLFYRRGASVIVLCIKFCQPNKQRYTVHKKKTC